MSILAVKRKIYFNEYNPFSMNVAYLPLISGKLCVYAELDDVIRAQYEFQPFLFRINTPDAILAVYDSPSVAAFSLAIWNEQLCLRVAEEVKRRWPDCLIIFGGTQIPHNPIEFLKTHSFVDVAAPGEGEEPFQQILRRFLDSRDFSGIDRVGFRTASGEIVVNPDSGVFVRDLDLYPSPYLEGLYDDLIVANPDLRFQAIIETNRGCPFHCTYCYWGKGGLSRKYRYFGLERVAAEFDWIGRNRIAFVYNADSNFGMHRRDEDIAQIMVDTRRKYGFPEKVVNLYGKNTDERIYNITRLLYDNGMNKGVGLSRQSMSDTVLKNIKRANIKLETYEILQRKFEAEGISVFCELIIALPGETYESFVEGIETLLAASSYGQLIIVLCELYPNTEMADPEYQKEHGIISRRNLSQGVHSRIQDENWVPEYIDYVVGTKTMPTADWKRTGILSWAIQMLLSFRLGYYLMIYLHHRLGQNYTDFVCYICDQRMSAETGHIWREELAHYDAFMEQILDGRGRAVVVPGFGDIYWAVEEASFLRITQKPDQFCNEMLDIACQFLTDRNVVFNEDELCEVMKYQRMRIPTPVLSQTNEYLFKFNLPEYFEVMARNGKPELRAVPQEVRVQQLDFGGDNYRFAREKLLWARRGGQFEVEFTWYDTATAPLPLTEFSPTV